MQKGFSLVQVLISMALASGLGVVLMRQAELQKNITTGAAAQSELSIHSDLLKLHLSRKDVCEALFQGVPIPAGLASITEIKGVNGLMLVKTQGPSATGIPEAISLTKYIPESAELTDFDESLKTAVLKIKYEKDGDFYGSKLLQKNLMIRYEGTTNIETCSAAILDGVAMEQSCEKFEGFEWDSTEEKCKKKDMKLYVSTHSTSGNSNITLPGHHDFCTLSASGGEDGWKDSTHRLCELGPIKTQYRKWFLKSELHEGRSNVCTAVCFSYREPTSGSVKSIHIDPSMNTWNSAP